MVLEVRDNGIGMTEEVRAPLHGDALLDQARQRPVRGPQRRHGPGAVVRSVILEHHRATLDIESPPLEGALFRIQFPTPVSREASDTSLIIRANSY